jgi:hypothetical protein
MSHDQLFKELLQGCLAEFIAAFFPEVARRIDWSQVTFPNTELFTEVHQGRRRTLDLVAEVRALTGEPELILIHVEIEADPREEFAQRMYEYYTLLRRRRPLPVLPVAIFLKGGRGGVGVDTHSEAVFGFEVLRFQFHLVPLPDVPRRVLPPENPITHALAPLLADPPDDPVELLVKSLQGIGEGTTDPEKRALLAGFLQSYVPLSAEQLYELEARGRESTAPEVGQMVNYFEEIGRARGREEGREEGLRRAIVLVLGGRFGETGGAAASALEAIQSSEVLEDLVTHAGTDASLDEFLARLPVDAGDGE